MQKRFCLQEVSLLSSVAGGIVLQAHLSFAANTALPPPLIISSGWKLQDTATVRLSGSDVAQAKFEPVGWYAATVPGTVLTTLVKNHVYPEPLYGENNRPDRIPESLARNSYWY